MVRSADLSRAFYRGLGPAGLARRTRAEWDAEQVARLLRMIPADADVLDVGCGYGRVALALARHGRTVVGVDHSVALVKAAHDDAAIERLGAHFLGGSMTGIALVSERFDAVLCLWSTFNELLEVGEQIAAVTEMWRVLRSGGFALIEGPPWVAASSAELADGRRRGREGRVSWDYVEGLLNPHYRHDHDSLVSVCDAAEIADHAEVFEDDWGGRPRLFMRLRKP